MKKAKKQCLGFFGLALVTAMTAIAANVPTPVASAKTVPDSISVRVIGTTPELTINGITNDAPYTDMERAFVVDYENVEKIVITLEYTDLDGNVTTKTLDETIPVTSVGTEDYLIRLIK